MPQRDDVAAVALEEVQPGDVVGVRSSRVGSTGEAGRVAGQLHHSVLHSDHLDALRRPVVDSPVALAQIVLSEVLEIRLGLPVLRRHWSSGHMITPRRLCSVGSPAE